MLLKDTPIQRKVMMVSMLICGPVLLLTYLAFFAYEFYTFRLTSIQQLSTLGKIIAANSTASLAFDDRNNANEILTALRAEPHIVSASIYDEEGNLFSHYPADFPKDAFPDRPEKEGYRFEHSHLAGFQPVVQGNKRLGMLYLKSDMGAIYEQFQLYGGVVAVMITISLLLAYLLTKNLRQMISKPILALAETAAAFSNHQDYSVRAKKFGEDELGLLTDAFNNMLTQIQTQNAEIRLFNQNLEQKVVDRTNELQTANGELESFSYSVSHDLRAPLRAISGNAKILEEDYAGKFNSDGIKSLHSIMYNSKRMGELIDDLLAFSRLGRKEVTISEINMNALVKSIRKDLLFEGRENKMQFNLSILPPAKGDQALIKQVWINLISNAIKYSKHKPKTDIEIGAYEKDNLIVYYVKDNGAGFDMQYYNMLFGIFQRLHSQEEFEGTGIGLAIVQKIVHRHNGTVWAESKLNQGACFYFSLPNINS